MTKMITGLGCWQPVLGRAEVNRVVSEFLRLHSAGKFVEARKVLDKSVAAETLLLASRLIEALKKVWELQFVGLTEHWEATVALFHATFQRRSKILPIELHNMRPRQEILDHFEPNASNAANEELNSTTLQMHDERLLEGLWDAADEELYRLASKRFSRDVRRCL